MSLAGPLLTLWLTGACTSVGTETSDTSGPNTDCGCGEVTRVSAVAMPLNSLSQDIEVVLEGPDSVEVACTLTQAPSR